MVQGRIAVRNRIILAILLPIFLVGLAASLVSVHISAKPIVSFIERRTEAELKLASSLALNNCEERLNYLIGLRLENQPEMISSLRNESMHEVVAVSKSFHKIYLLIVEDGNGLVASSIPVDDMRLPSLGKGTSGIMAGTIGGRPVRMHSRYFPFWRWHVVSFIYEADYMEPVLMAKRTILLVSLSVLVLVMLTVILVFGAMVNAPLKRIIGAAGYVAVGRFPKLNMNRQDEIGQVASAFDSMVNSLRDDKNYIGSIMEELKESEERYRILTENSLAMVTVVHERRLIYANRKTIESFGYAPSELMAMDVLDLFHPDDRQLVEQEIKSSGQGNTTTELREVRYVTKTGETRWLDILAIPLAYKGKNALLCHALDATQRRMAQDEQKKLESRLRQAEKMETLGTFVGAVAHDLNNILAGLVGYPDLLLMQIPEDSRLRKSVLAIQQSGQKAAAIVQDLLTMVRRGVAVREVLCLNNVIIKYMESPEFERLRAFHADVHFQADLREDLLNISGSSVHLSKTVMNLISNAAEAMPEGGLVRISTSNCYLDKPIQGYDAIKEGDYVVLSISDTGVGISREDLARIFEPFYTKKVMGRSGTGLGMSVVWATVKDHSGYIRAESTVGKGTTFDLYFPSTAESLPRKARVSPVDSYKGTETVLVVDDVKEQRELACDMLSRLGYTVTAVSCGEEAVEYLKTKSVDLLILDMIMDPGIDGLETFKRVIELRPRQKAIVASGFSETGRVREALHLGAGAYVPKPYTLEKLASAVRSALDDSHTARIPDITL
jgi:PAS domain S-box-containing protein